MKTTKEQIALNLSTFFNANLTVSHVMEWMSLAIQFVQKDSELTAKEKDNLIGWLTMPVSDFIRHVFSDKAPYNADPQLTNLQNALFECLFTEVYNQTALNLYNINRAFLNKYLTGELDRSEIEQFIFTQGELMGLLEIYREYDELYVGEAVKAKGNFLQPA